MRARYRAWQSHRNKSAKRRRQPRSSCRQEATTLTRDRTPSPLPSAPGMCTRISAEAVEPLVPPVTTTMDWRPTSTILTTVRTCARTGTGIGCGYGILQIAADRDPSPPPPASRSRPPLSSTDSDDDLSDLTVVDIGLETDTAIIGIDHYSDFSEPGSPTAAASLDRAAAMASATLSSSTAEGTSAYIREYPLSLDLAGFIDSFKQNIRYY